MIKRIKSVQNFDTREGSGRDWPYFLTAAAIVAVIICGAMFLPRALGKTVEILPLSETEDLAVGGHFYFGSYPQYTAVPEPVEWRVLAVEDGKALVISDQLLDCRKFDTSSGAWEPGTLRYWLNNGFLTDTFSDAEKERILLTENTDTGTEDRIFCLSAEEVKRYLGKAERLAAPTAYAVERGANTNTKYMFTSTLNTGWWWLRSPGSTDTIVQCVNADGGISGVRANSGGGCVRPAMWVSVAGE